MLLGALASFCDMGAPCSETGQPSRLSAVPRARGGMAKKPEKKRSSSTGSGRCRPPWGQGESEVGLAGLPTLTVFVLLHCSRSGTPESAATRPGSARAAARARARGWTFNPASASGFSLQWATVTRRSPEARVRLAHGQFCAILAGDGNDDLLDPFAAQLRVAPGDVHVHEKAAANENGML